MPDIRDIETKRKEAYAFIVRSVKSNVLLPKVDSDKALAKYLSRPQKLRDKSINAEAEVASMHKDLIDLKEGKGNPTQRVIDGFREQMGPLVRESSIEEFLINPFKNQ